MSKSAKNLDELFKMLNQEAKKAIAKKNSNTIKTAIETGKSRVETDVYSYKPKRYERTGKLKESWEVTESVEGIILENTRRDEDTGKYIPYTIETGEGYEYSGYGYDYEKPRPFVENTGKDLDDGRIKEAVKKDLINSGFNVK